MRVIRENLVPKILLLMEGWEKIEKRHQIRLLKGSLGVLSHVCDLSK